MSVKGVHCMIKPKCDGINGWFNIVKQPVTWWKIELSCCEKCAIIGLRLVEMGHILCGLKKFKCWLICFSSFLW